MNESDFANLCGYADVVNHHTRPPAHASGEAADSWLVEVVPAVERSIGDLFDNFIHHPFTHRREHSLHVDLYQSLRSQPLLSRRYEIGVTGFTTRLVHKEWPSTQRFSLSGKQKPKRQSYDIGVLSPQSLRSISVNQFTDGVPPAMIAIELGLDYSFGHLKGDIEKLKRNAVRHAYVVHFSRIRTRLSRQIEELIRETSETTKIKTAFAHLDVDKGVYICKTLDGADFEASIYEAIGEADLCQGTTPTP